MKEAILHSSTMYFEVVEVIIYYYRTAGASLRDFYFTPLCTYYRIFENPFQRGSW